MTGRLVLMLTWATARLAAANDLRVGEEEYRLGVAASENALLAREHFRRAATHFENAWYLGERSPALACNLAQTYLLLGDRALAVQSYRRGLRWFPNDPNLLAGLDRIRSESIPDWLRPPDPWVVGLTRSLGAVRGLSLVFWIVGWTLAIRALQSNVGRGWRLMAGMLLAGAVTVEVLAWLAAREARAYWSQPVAVVRSDQTILRRGNHELYPARLEQRLPAGTELRVLNRRGGWLQVEVGAKLIGWVSHGQVIEVDTASADGDPSQSGSVVP